MENRLTNTFDVGKKRGRPKASGTTKDDLGRTMAAFTKLVGLATGHTWWDIPEERLTNEIADPLCQIMDNASPAMLRIFKTLTSAVPYITLGTGIIGVFALPVALELEARKKEKNGTTQQRGQIQPSGTTGYPGGATAGPANGNDPSSRNGKLATGHLEPEKPGQSSGTVDSVPEFSTTIYPDE